MWGVHYKSEALGVAAMFRVHIEEKASVMAFIAIVPVPVAITANAISDFKKILNY